MIDQVEEQRAALAEPCQQFRVRPLHLFGPATTGAFVPATGDLNFVAEFAETQSMDYADRYLDFTESLD